MSTPSPDPDATARVDSDVRYTPYPRSAQPQFAPGTVIAGRYRIAGILGSGGMGEVYRADDVKLDQPVALKFLPARLARDPVLLARLHDEVRLGRQVAHPNVCRIYDIVDSDGAHFVAMEFVDGEDLSRLLRRIGRLAHDKAVDIARGIAAGLMAAHAKGILHRDLKPANVMIDSRGDARIMDFGLALGAGEDDGTISGTPAYMAPELLDGQAATIQTDLYALGLVMYELFTGKRAHGARTLPERIRDLGSEITTPSSHIRDIDPAVERIILRCLAHDPAQRPRSTREVIEALPGGDPLAAAMAAGETPSPRLIAAAGIEGSLRPAIAWSLLALTVLLIVATLALRREMRFVTVAAGLQKPPAVLADRAETILRQLHLPPAAYSVSAFWPDGQYLGWIYEHEPRGVRWKRPRKGLPLLYFWLREEPEPPADYAGTSLDSTPDRPPLATPGSKVISIDPQGRLLGLTAIPDARWPARPLDWKPLLTAAGFDPAQLQPAQPKSVPLAASDARAAWTGKHPGDGTPLRIEAAAWRGTPVWFQILAPWHEAEDLSQRGPFGPAFELVQVVLFSIVAMVAVVLAWRNLRLRRGDRPGALRFAAAMALLTFVHQFLRADHALHGVHELRLAAWSAREALLYGGLFWLFYIALEPFLRRRWPDRLISWSRLLAGDWRNAMVGRDVLIGLAGGMTHAAAASAGALWFLDVPVLGNVFALSRVNTGVSALAGSIRSGLVVGMTLMIGLMIFTLVLRRRALAVVATGAVMYAMFLFATTDPRTLVMQLFMVALGVGIAARFGLLAAAAVHTAFAIVFFYPLPEGFGWYTATGVIPVAAVLILALIAFRISLGGQSAFNAKLLDDQA